MGKVHKFVGWNEELSPLTLLCYNEDLPLVLKMEPLEPSNKESPFVLKICLRMDILNRLTNLLNILIFLELSFPVSLG